MEAHSFHKVLGDSHIAQNSAETTFPQNLYTRKLCKILVFCSNKSCQADSDEINAESY